MVTLLISILLVSDTLTLYPEDAVRLALEKNFEIREAIYRLESAEIQKKEALFSLIPSGTLYGNYSKYRQEGKTFEKRGYTFNLEQSIFDPEKFVSYYSAKNNLKIQHLTYSNLKADVTVKTLKLYYRVLTIREKVDYLRQTVELARKEFETLKERQSAGLATELDVLRGRINYLQNQNSMKQAEIELERAKRELKFQLGIPAETEIMIGVKGIPFENFRMQLSRDIVDSIVRLKEAYRKVLLQAENAEWNHKRALFSFLPKVYLGFRKVHDTINPGYSSDYSTSGFYVNFSINLNSYPFNVRLQKKEVQLMRLYHKKTTYSILKNIDDAYDGYKAAIHDLELQRENQKLASLLYEKSYQEYRAGKITSLEYFDAQVRLREANLRLIEARYNYYVSLISLKTLLGLEVLR